MHRIVQDLITKNAKVIFDREINALLVTLSGFIPLERMKEIFHHEFDIIQCFKLKKCIIDLRGIGVYAQGVPELIQNFWFPQIVKEGVEHVAFVVPDSVFGQISMNKSHKEGQQKENHQYFNDFDSAVSWLKQAQAA